MLRFQSFLTSILLGFATIMLAASPSSAEEKKPAVLFCGDLHHAYVAKPLVAMGFEVDKCDKTKLAERLASGKYNVAVLGVMDEAERKAVDEFLAKGGGVFLGNPEGSYDRPDDWTKTNEWLTKLGARPRFELLKDDSKDNVVTDDMGCRLSFSDQIDPTFKDGVRGVLTLLWQGTGGIEPPMSFDLSSDWKVVVRGADTLITTQEKRNDQILQEWQSKEGFGKAPPLMAVRQVGKGRLAIVGIRAHWLFWSPKNCPTTEHMLTSGAGGKPSDWLRLFANTFRYLAEPGMKDFGGAVTPPKVLEPPSEFWPLVPPLAWQDKPAQDHKQYAGLIGAQTALSTGSGTVAEYVKEAKSAGLQFIVFLEDSLKMDQAKWDQLVAECNKASDDSFAAIPGLTLEDAQGNHMYCFSDDVRFPKPNMLLPDNHMATVKQIRSGVWFDYINELVAQHAINGFWNHKANLLIPADYKLYNSFPIYSFKDGKQIDDAFDSFRYLQSVGGCQVTLAFEFMSGPSQVAGRAKDGWRVITYRPPQEIRTKWWERAMTFSGMDYSTYITRGPTIPVWESPNRMAETHGEWWRPDIDEYRVRFRTASDVGLKSVTLYDGQSVFRRWLAGGAKTFEQELVLANGQQHGFYLVVEDTQGRQAVSMSFWIRNLRMASYLLTDRCNFMGDCRLRSPKGDQFWIPVGFGNQSGIPANKGALNLTVQPAIWLTAAPTLPIDGAPGGTPPALESYGPAVPGELGTFFSSPTMYLVSPEIAVGQSDYLLAYDPAEETAKTTQLGYAYTEKQQGSGDAWASWYKLIPTRKLAGWTRTYACNILAQDSFRIGWQETNATLKDSATLEKGKGVQVVYSQGQKPWTIFSEGKALPATDAGATVRFGRGTYAVVEDKAGVTLAIGMDDQLVCRYAKDHWTLEFTPEGKTELAKGDAMHYTFAFAGANAATPMAKMQQFVEKFGVAKPGTVGYAPAITRGKQLDNYLVWRLQADAGQCIEAKIPKADLPGFLATSVAGLNDNWSVFLLDRKRAKPNYRGLPIRDGVAWAQLDLTQAGTDLFIGHPVIADNKDARLLVAWKEPGTWCVEAHNHTDQPMKLKVSSCPGWTVFSFNETIELPAGASKTWTVQEAK